MTKFFRAIKPEAYQLVAGFIALGYGLFLVYPPAAPITLGLILIADAIIPARVAK